MKTTPLHRRLLLSALAAVSLCASAQLPTAGVERGPQRRSVQSPAETEARVIVKFKADSALMRALSASGTSSGPQQAHVLSSRLGLSLNDGRMLGPRTQVIKGGGNLSSRQLADRLAAQADVEYAVVDGRMHALAAPSDPLYASGQVGSNVPPAGQWYLRAPTSATIVDNTSVVSAIDAEAAWGVTTGSSSIVVADLDTGVRFDHPDLTGKVLPGYDFIHDIGTANDGDVRDANASDPGDYVTSADVGVVAGCTSSDVSNSSWHGTQTAGLIGAATNNGIGMASVGRNVMVLPARVLGKCGGYDSDILAAMAWSAGISVPGVPANPTPAKVLNMSLGAAGACSQAYTDAIAQVNAAGAVVVVAAGNDGLDVGTPANCAGAIAVAGVRHSGSKVGYSDLGTTVSIAAPAGNCVNGSGLACLFPLLTTSNTGTTVPVAASYTGSGSDASLGTSFSAPLVSGTAALIYSANPVLTPAQLLIALKSTARPFPTTGFDANVKACTAPTSVAQNAECYCTTSTCGAGLLDAGAATAMAAAIHPSITASATSVVAGTVVTLDGSGSWPSGGASAISTYQWTITSGASSASLTSSTSSSAALQTSAAGSVVVNLLITDSAGKQATNSVTLSVSAAPTPPATSSGGGGAMPLGWLLGWLASVIGVWVVTPRPRRR